ncbi:AAA family ATPase [Marivita geojedonensis]|uniref:Response regulatory domain-containing protein n=1 Tax=Marivita geojedonensis TaxID=1123756 RepID=A0A1X4NC91_9RHOB|nr:MinD/ParA family protein [Marivita geojedonensis]OSQ44326.1 hypothetical protein MGEO_19105 [Marivita geojedonensis]PRY72906.1 pilus assembly protein CpaE [Marivita geojedonensis]
MNIASVTRVVIVIGAALDESEALHAFSKHSRFIVTQVRVDEISSDPSVVNADVIVVDIGALGEEELEILTRVRAQVADAPLILISEALKPAAMRQILKFDIDDWLPKPVDVDGLFAAINNSVRTKRIRTNQVNAVVSCVGGAGATTVAIGMADLACQMLKKKNPNIALVDLDFSTGNCGYALNMVSSFDLGSVAATPRRIDGEFLSVIQQRHDAGFYLYSFKCPNINVEHGGFELILRLLDAVSLEHSTLFLDIPYYATEWRNDVFAAVNTCTLVSEVNLPAINQTLDVIQEIQELRGKDFPIHVIFNKHTRKLFGTRISQRKLKELLGDTEFSFLPVDDSNIGEAIDRGVLLSEISGNSSFLRKLSKYVEQHDFLKAKAE